MTYAISMDTVGGPEVMQWVEVAVGAPGPGEARVRHEAVGLNYIDVYFRSGVNPQPLPSGLGMEGAGIVEAVGEGVTHVQVGDRVAYAGRPNGAYAQARVMPAKLLIKLPDALSFEQGAAMMLQGLTVEYLLNRVYKAKAGDVVVLHAAAGGVGLLACQWAKALGVTVIGTVSTPEKAELAKAHGCTHVVMAGSGTLVQTVKELTHGQGVPVVFDSVGKDTFTESLDCIAPLGLMVSFGNASGPVAPFELAQLAMRGSLAITRPTLMTFTERREWLESMAQNLFEMVLSGKINIPVNQRYELKNVAQAHRDLEARKTTGSTILMP